MAKLRKEINMKKIPIHSVTSLITNSSTTIFTYSNGTIEPFKTLVNEMFKLFGVNKVCDDVFELKIVKGDNDEFWDKVLDYIYNCEEDDEGSELLLPDGEVDEDKIRGFLDDVTAGKIDKPDWLEDIEYESDKNYSAETYLEIKTKDPEYENLARLAINFLYSTTHEAFIDG